MEFIATDEVRAALQKLAEAYGLEVTFISTSRSETYVGLKKAQMGFPQEEQSGEDEKSV